MKTRNLSTSPLRNPRLSLVLYWVFWKILLLLVASTSPGPGYDTSTHVLLAQNGTSVDTLQRSTFVSYALQKLVRWDAIYFTQIAHRGYRFEQEWAFGWGFTRLLSLGSKGMIWWSI